MGERWWWLHLSLVSIVTEFSTAKLQLSLNWPFYLSSAAKLGSMLPLQDLLLYILPRWFKIRTLYAFLKEEIQIWKLTSALIPLTTEKCHPLTSRTDSGMDSLIRNMLYRGLSVPKMNDQCLFENPNYRCLHKHALVQKCCEKNNQTWNSI